MRLSPVFAGTFPSFLACTTRNREKLVKRHFKLMQWGKRYADEDHYYVPKKVMGYVLWNRLNQVSNPVRLDEIETTNG